MMEHMETSDFFELHQAHPNLKILDVRETNEYQSVHYEKALSCPLSTLNVAQAEKTFHLKKHEPLYLICLSGGRSQRAGHMFLDAGFIHVINITGGMSAWQKHGLPVMGIS